VVIDRREQDPLPFSRLETRPGTLATGDYSIAGLENRGLFAVERKSIEDLVACAGVNRERFEAQLLRLCGYSFARLLIVGNEETILEHRYHSAITPRPVLASLYAFEARYVPIVWSPTPQTAARLVERYATWFARELRRSASLLGVENPRSSETGGLNQKLMKHLLPRILQSTDLVNRTVQDPWIEGYLESLEWWRIQANAQGVALAYLRDAWGEYGKYCTRRDPFFRHSTWLAIQAAAAALRPSINYTPPE
jgi:hypothetical protein